MNAAQTKINGGSEVVRYLSLNTVFIALL